MRLKARNVIATVLAVPLLGVLTLTGSAGATASGCTLAPGGWGSQNCVEVYGSGVTINWMRGAYNSGAVPTNICSVLVNFKYRRAGASGYSVLTKGTSNCSVWRSWIDHTLNAAMTNNTQACTQQKNSNTGGLWSNYACVSVYR